MNQEQLTSLLEQVREGSLDISDALRRLRTLPYENLGFASLDHHRVLRQGFPEVIFCEGKTERQVVAIARTLLSKNDSLLATRVDRSVAKALLRLEKQAVYHESARVVSIASPKQVRKGSVLIVTAGTADIPVAEEARVTAETMGSYTETLYDVGVAGLHRLLGQQDRLHDARVLVVAAGMDGVLPSVVGGVVRQPVVAVPTSRGYGAHFGGLAALLTMLNSCAAGVAVMNIDNGFGAGCLAHRINMVGEETVGPGSEEAVGVRRSAGRAGAKRRLGKSQR
ncbi:MAG: nickel pincer cofactor biosynthesis protein LarB [Nitrospiraceae bacterium]